MLRRGLASLSAGAEMFPTPQSVLPRTDPWALPMNLPQGRRLPVSSITSALLRRDYQTGWYMFSNSVQPFEPEMCSKLLAILPSGTHTAHQWWPRAQQIKTVMQSRAQRLTATDYAVLINLAARAGELATVRALWLEMAEHRVVRDTNVWNQYMAAVCDANPEFWPWKRSRSTSFANYASRSLALPPDPITDLLERMELEGVPRNTRTYEITLLALARVDAENLVACRQIVERIWLSGLQTPGLSTLTSIVNSWAFHFRLREGFDLVQMVASSYSAGLGLGSMAADQFWTRLLRLVAVQTEPRRGGLPASYFGEVFKLMSEQYAFTPSLGVWSIRIEFLESKTRFDEMCAAIPSILSLHGGYELAQSALGRAVVGMANTDRAMDGLKALQAARTLGVEPERDLEGYLAKRGATVGQLELFEEDDDEDRIGGF